VLGRRAVTDFAFTGRHVIADIYDIHAGVIEDEQLILGGLVLGIARSGATVCGMQTKRFEPSGLTAIYLLSESHVSVHTYPAQRSLFFDAFTCGDRCEPDTIMTELVAALGPCRQQVEIVPRGYLVGEPVIGERRLLGRPQPAPSHPSRGRTP